MCAIKLLPLLLGLVIVIHSALAVSGEVKDPEMYQARRAELCKSLADGATVLFGRTEKDFQDLHTSFYQEPNFYYLTGWQEPGAVVFIMPGSEQKQRREILFLPRRNPEGEKWTGRKTGPAEPNVRRITGFEIVLPAETVETELRKLLDLYPRLYTLATLPHTKKLEALAPWHEINDAAVAIGKLRIKKSPQEIRQIQRATDVTLQAHRAGWKRVAPGVYEYQVAAAMSAVYLDEGCERSAYAPIVGSGGNSTVLHYSHNSRRMERGDVLLVDVGAECSSYVTDITRTVPVGGKFSKRQREIYDIVLAAQKATIGAVKPGMTLSKTSPNTLYKIAYDYINSHGKDQHGDPLGKYFTHGIGHHVGLEVHDASNTALPLEPGMVITIEPGIYIPEENIGIRVEDVVLVTENGAKVLSAALPREPEEIERALAR